MMRHADVQRALEATEQMLLTSVPELGQSDAGRLLNDLMTYSLKIGGKRLRPTLLLETLRAFGGNPSEGIEYAAALEMIHTYSLIHDDLPCMDDDDFRRGHPTLHTVYGEDMGVLAGDALLSEAAERLLQAALSSRGAERSLCAAASVLRAAGVRGMILGQVADIRNQQSAEEMTLETLDFINAHKTGALMGAAMEAGAFLAGRSQTEAERVYRTGVKLGRLFQVVDDILDVVGDPAVLGKATQVDARNHMCTYPKILGIDGAREHVQALAAEIYEEMAAWEADVSYLQPLVTFMTERTY